VLRFEDDAAGGPAAVVGGGEAFLAASTAASTSCALRSGRSGTGTGIVAALYLYAHLQKRCYGLCVFGMSSIYDLSSEPE
jgi:hypothetical protein